MPISTEGFHLKLWENPASITSSLSPLPNREIRDWVKPTKVAKTLPTILDRPFTVPEPFGVVLVIGAWNYPLHLTLAPVAGAIAAGNCVVMKPSEISPATARAIEELVPRYVDPECFKVRMRRRPGMGRLWNI